MLLGGWLRRENTRGTPGRHIRVRSTSPIPGLIVCLQLQITLLIYKTPTVNTGKGKGEMRIDTCVLSISTKFILQQRIPKQHITGYSQPRGKQNLRKKRGGLTPEPGRHSASFLPGMMDHVSFAGWEPRPISYSLLFIPKVDGAAAEGGGYTFKMAARWRVGEETLTACSMDFFAMDTLDEVNNLFSTHPPVPYFNC